MVAIILYVAGGAAREVCVQRRCRELLLRTGASGLSAAAVGTQFAPNSSCSFGGALTA